MNNHPSRRTRLFPIFVLGVAIVASSLLAGCPSQLRRYRLADPLWEDPDRNPVQVKPEEYYSPFASDVLDQTLFWPVSRVLSVDVVVPSVNVNSMDEVPNSSWFTNRIGNAAGTGEPWTLEDTARGSCPDELLSVDGPWTVTAAKPNGANPGFIIKGNDGKGYLLKMDGGFTAGERATAADVFGSRLYEAVGYNSPCNFIVFFDPAILQIDPDATTTDELGKKNPMTQEDVDQVLAMALVRPDGRLRASASLFLSGKPLGPWRYNSTRLDDPNDVVRHEDRRDLRGARVLASWLNHFDAREQNTLTMWVEEDGRNYVKHHYIDFGDCFGSRWAQDGLSRRFGYSHYLHLGHVLSDLFTFGAIPRPWQQVSISEVAPGLGYFDVEHFDPPKWKAGYPNPAFTRMQDEDGAWMARILAHVTDDHVRTMLDEAQMADKVSEEELYKTIIGRRQRILEHYLRVRSPLTNVETRSTDGQERVCFTDLAVATRVTDPRLVRYESRMYYGRFSEPAWGRQEFADSPIEGPQSCIALVEGDQRPARHHPTAGPGSAERYAILDIITWVQDGGPAIPPLRLHLYDMGDEGFRLVGIERPGDDSPPGHR